jgi:SAM-dependent methyltransferase
LPTCEKDRFVPYEPFLESLRFDYYISSNCLKCEDKNGQTAYEIEFIGRPPEGGIALVELFRTNNSRGLFLDCGTGSGVVSIGIASRGLGSFVAVDISIKQCRLAIQNVRRNRLQHAITILLSDFTSGFNEQTFDAIISNPPQLPTTISGFDIRDFAGSTGFEAIDKLILQSMNCLTEGGYLWLYVLGFLGIDERTGKLPSLFERLEKSGFKPRIVGRFSRKLTRISKIHVAFPLIRRLYPHSDVARNYPHMSSYDVYVLQALKS